MDIKDKKILGELLINSRIPVSKLAKKVGVSREVALYRLNRLIKKGIIFLFYAIIDAEKMSYSRYTCFFQLKGISNPKEKDFFIFLKNHKFVSSLSPVIGKWNVVFDLLAKNKAHLQSLTNEIKKYIKPYLESYRIISSPAEQETFPSKLLGIRNELKPKRIEQEIKIDDQDKKILIFLSENSRIEYVELSRKLNLTANAIKYRIKRLERSGIIEQYTISIDIRKLNYEWHNVQLKLIKNQKDHQLKQFLRQHHLVIYYYKYGKHSDWDFDVGLIVKNSLELRKFILELKEHFGDVLKIHDSYSVLEETKANYCPEGIFK